jgi:hypothetical protein
MNENGSDQNATTFLTELDTGLNYYRAGGVKKQRLGALHQLAALMNFAETLPGVQQRLLPLRHLLFAFGGIDTGYRDNLIVGEKVGHRSSLPIFEMRRRAFVAAAMDFYIRAGRSKSDAALKVARTLRGQPGYENITSNIVAKWRETSMTEWYRERFAALGFKFKIEELEKRYPQEPEQAGDHLLAALKDGQLP